jgi:2-phosphosulfolactate phosphatase
MRIRIDLLPRSEYAGEWVVLVDTLRSCTVAPILFDNGLSRLVLCASIREARRAAAQGRVLVGERGGVPPEGFNHSNSPAALLNVDFTGKEAVVVSDNAPKALPLLSAAEQVLLGSLYNARAVAAVLHASGVERVSIVCSGYHGHEDLDDAVTAGFLAGEIERLANGPVALEGAAGLALGLLRAFPDPIGALWHSSAGRELRRLESADDLAVACTVSHSSWVPRLVSVEAARHADLFHFEATEAQN